jgi:hypothetical protein
MSNTYALPICPDTSIGKVSSLFLNKKIIPDTLPIRLDTHIGKVSVKSLFLNKKVVPDTCLIRPDACLYL